MSRANLSNDLDKALVNVLDRRPVAVVVEIDLDERLRVLREPEEDIENERLLFDSRRSHLEDRQENLVQKNLDFFLPEETDGKQGKLQPVELRTCQVERFAPSSYRAIL